MANEWNELSKQEKTVSAVMDFSTVLPFSCVVTNGVWRCLNGHLLHQTAL